MIPFLDCSPQVFKEKINELNLKKAGQLLSPLTNYKINEDVIFGVDNGGYTTQNLEKWIFMLNKITNNIDKCMFVALPDVPGSAIRTLELFDIFVDLIPSGWPTCLIIQNGSENINIPWNKIKAIFIAGSGDWRMGDGAKHIIQTAKWLGKWIHVGRISHPDKWDYFRNLGCDSADSSVLVRPFPGRTDKLSAYFKEIFKDE